MSTVRIVKTSSLLKFGTSELQPYQLNPNSNNKKVVNLFIEFHDLKSDNNFDVCPNCISCRINPSDVKKLTCCLCFGGGAKQLS